MVVTRFAGQGDYCMQAPGCGQAGELWYDGPSCRIAWLGMSAVPSFILFTVSIRIKRMDAR